MWVCLRVCVCLFECVRVCVWVCVRLCSRSDQDSEEMLVLKKEGKNSQKTV